MFFTIWLLIMSWVVPVPVQPFEAPAKSPSGTPFSGRYTHHDPPKAGCPPRC